MILGGSLAAPTAPHEPQRDGCQNMKDLRAKMPEAIMQAPSEILGSSLSTV